MKERIHYGKEPKDKLGYTLKCQWKHRNQGKNKEAKHRGKPEVRTRNHGTRHCGIRKRV